MTFKCTLYFVKALSWNNIVIYFTSLSEIFVDLCFRAQASGNVHEGYPQSSAEDQRLFRSFRPTRPPGVHVDIETRRKTLPATNLLDVFLLFLDLGLMTR
jgi:hypothetical protein